MKHRLAGLALLALGLALHPALRAGLLAAGARPEQHAGHRAENRARAHQAAARPRAGHVKRVRNLAKEGFYDGLTFHRVIPGFMAQTGDPDGTGGGGSKYVDLKAEFSKERFARGSVGAARTTEPDTANSQFFICYGVQCGQLTGSYTLWGEVIEGMEHVDKIAPGEPPRVPDKMLKVYLLANKK